MNQVMANSMKGQYTVIEDLKNIFRYGFQPALDIQNSWSIDQEVCVELVSSGTPSAFEMEVSS